MTGGCSAPAWWQESKGPFSPRVLRRREDDGAASPAQQSDMARQAAHADEHWCCAACGVKICHGRDAREMGGAHRHRFTNPHGLHFQVRCFDVAQGLRAEGEATATHSWFAGYRWRVVLCASCLSHLGWHFEADDDDFYGLIAPRLVDCTAPAGRPS